MEKPKKSKTETPVDEQLFKNKIIIKGITLVLNEIIEENAKEEKRRVVIEKRNSNIRASILGKYININYFPTKNQTIALQLKKYQA
jgi:hypothetical protein